MQRVLLRSTFLTRSDLSLSSKLVMVSSPRVWAERTEQKRMLPFLIPPCERLHELTREVAYQHPGLGCVFTLITVKICPAAQWAQVTMATFQQHRSHKLQQRSKSGSTQKLKQSHKEGLFLKDTSLLSSHWDLASVQLHHQNKRQFTFLGRC